MHVVQDMLVPLRGTGEALKVSSNSYWLACAERLSLPSSLLQVMHDEFRVYPLWLCPFKLIRPEQKHVRPFCQPLPDDDMFIDIGAYGVPKVRSPPLGCALTPRGNCRRQT